MTFYQMSGHLIQNKSFQNVILSNIPSCDYKQSLQNVILPNVGLYIEQKNVSESLFTKCKVIFQIVLLPNVRLCEELRRRGPCKRRSCGTGGASPTGCTGATSSPSSS